MTSHLTLDKNTHVAFIDVNEAAENANIRVISISEQFGLRSQLLARVDTNNEVVLGLIVEDYPAFKREIRRKYIAFRVGKIVDLILCSLKVSLDREKDAHHGQMALARF